MKETVNIIENMETNPKENKNQKKRWILLGSVLCLIVLSGILFLHMSNKDGAIHKKLELGNHYLEEIEYEQALAVFEEVLLIDPENPEAYLGIVEVYIRWNEVDKALEYAQKGYEVTGDERLKEKEEMILSGQIYDSQGRELRMTHYKDGEIIWMHNFTYNKNGELARVDHCSADGTVVESGDILYDENGNCVQNYGHFVDSGDLVKYISKYENNQEILSIGYLNRTNEKKWKYEYDHDDNGNLQKEVDYDYYDNVWHLDTTRLYRYNSDGNCIRIDIYNENDTLAEYWIMAYEGENCIKEESYDAQGKCEWKHIYEYDDEDNCIKVIAYDGSGNLEYEENYY